MIPLAIDEVIVHLIKHDFLNEERFARSFARGKFRLKKMGGATASPASLYAMGLTDYLIEAGLEEIDEDEYQEVFDTVAEKEIHLDKRHKPL